MKDNGGPAFPCPVGHITCNHPVGMTLRDYFASKAMLHLTMPYRADDPEDTAEKARQAAQVAYAIADAMINERKS